MVDVATVPLLPLEAYGETFFVELARVTGIESAEDLPPGVPVVAWDDRFLIRSGYGQPGGAAPNEKAITVQTPQGERAIPADYVGRVRETPASDILPLPRAARSRIHPAIVGVVLSEEQSNADPCEPAGWVLDPVRLVNPETAGGMHLPPERLARRIADALPIAKRSTDAMRCLVSFDPGLGDDVRFALSATQVVCLSPPQTVTPVPTATDDLVGLTVWCGCPVPVVDLAVQFGSSVAQPHEMLLLARDHDTRELIGFPAACHVELIRPSLDLRPIRCPLEGPAAAAFTSGERRFVVPRLSAIINAPAALPERASAKSMAAPV